ncbi:hypothetical protein PF005_g28014 [Phytophthora fragariae]|uniref:DDE Tnp4 domain-containing protein n=1 Tax=Phytophthora fragariae TaxID=53985 RepID=A0A6A3DMW6_9STRA|nr:hypothetical protein PF009_g26476 [Phytophthora fragariae]KAE9067439.1 hypothetical protein PF007_g28072 [Phytophthora fragariae]KAE9169339.1 hypothetical protein PF005_g28014 [Phytophthora fragariae]KAE9175695.1 hypothetical protein PF002_g28729 [Phytophthora fragariae]
MTPFPDDENLSEEQRLYNYIHSFTRMKIEGAFGLLKERFLRKLLLLLL